LAADFGAANFFLFEFADDSSAKQDQQDGTDWCDGVKVDGYRVAGDNADGQTRQRTDGT